MFVIHYPYNKLHQAPGMMSVREAALSIDRSVSWLRRARRRGEGPPSHEVRGRMLYKRCEVEAWLNRVNRDSEDVE